MVDIDSLCHPEEDFTTSQTDPGLGQQLLQWLDNRFSPLAPPPDSNTHNSDNLNNSAFNISG